MMVSGMLTAKNVEHKILYKDRFAYCAHPFVTTLANGDWLMVFNESQAPSGNLASSRGSALLQFDPAFERSGWFVERASGCPKL